MFDDFVENTFLIREIYSTAKRLHLILSGYCLVFGAFIKPKAISRIKCGRLFLKKSSTGLEDQ